MPDHYLRTHDSSMLHLVKALAYERRLLFLRKSRTKSIWISFTIFPKLIVRICIHILRLLLICLQLYITLTIILILQGLDIGLNNNPSPWCHIYALPIGLISCIIRVANDAQVRVLALIILSTDIPGHDLWSHGSKSTTVVSLMQILSRCSQRLVSLSVKRIISGGFDTITVQTIASDSQLDIIRSIQVLLGDLRNILGDFQRGRRTKLLGCCLLGGRWLINNATSWIDSSRRQSISSLLLLVPFKHAHVLAIFG